jgi:light-regulated signal transduction histidine kinase (bacteriophytochrome)
MFSDVVVQSYALVLVAERYSFRIKAVSENAHTFGGASASALLGMHVGEFFDSEAVAAIQEQLSEDFPTVIPVRRVAGWADGRYQLIVHSFMDELVIEVEPRRSWPYSGDYAARLNDFTDELERAPDLNALLQRLCDGLIYHFGYDRAILLQFDRQGNSNVTHEAKEEAMDSFLNIHFVEDDVPPADRYSQIVGVVHNYGNVHTENYGMVGSFGAGAHEVLSRYIASRGPRPNVVRFLLDNNLSALGYLSLMIGGQLWASVYLHSRQSVYVDYQMRAFIRVVGRVCQQKIAYYLNTRAMRLRQAANSVRDSLQENIVNADNLVTGLTGGETTLIDLIPHTHGAAISSNEVLTLYQGTPTEQQVTQLIDWIKQKTDHGITRIWHTDALATVFPAAAPFQDKAAGVLLLPLDASANQWIAWFRPELPRDVIFGSQHDPHDTLSGRRYEERSTTLYGHARRWTSDDIGTALALQSFLQDVVMKRFTQSQRRNRLLQQAYDDLEVFSYTVGHDLRAPLRGITSFADILEEDFGDVLGEEGLRHLKFIQGNAERMRIFMTDLLALSRIDRSQVIVNPLSVRELAERALRDQETSEGNSFSLIIQDDLPPIMGDENHLQTVFNNLISNAIKYSAAREEPRITVGQSGTYRSYPLFFVEDNGIGIPADHLSRVFEIFNRAGNVGSIAGTGIGLALVKRIITFHEGEVWIESEEGKGTRFFFYSGMKGPQN